jgi:hypothetical protein
MIHTFAESMETISSPSVRGTLLFVRGQCACARRHFRIFLRVTFESPGRHTTGTNRHF